MRTLSKKSYSLQGQHHSRTHPASQCRRIRLCSLDLPDARRPTSLAPIADSEDSRAEAGTALASNPHFHRLQDVSVCQPSNVAQTTVNCNVQRRSALMDSRVRIAIFWVP